MTDEELRRFDALLCNGPLSRERGRDLVAEVRGQSRTILMFRKERDKAERQLKDTLAERDTLRAENERLQRELGGWRKMADAHVEALTASEAEAAELRASLADAVGKIAAMELVVEAARLRIHSAPNTTARVATDYDLADAVDAYEASLPGIVKVKP